MSRNKRVVEQAIAIAMTENFKRRCTKNHTKAVVHLRKELRRQFTTAKGLGGRLGNPDRPVLTALLNNAPGIINAIAGILTATK